MVHRRVLGAAALVVVVATTVTGPAEAGDGPIGQLRVDAVELTEGTVAVELRARCDGGGFERWAVQLDQRGRRDQATGRTRCDGATQRLTVGLEPAEGRFRRGGATMTVSAVGPCGADTCIGWARAERIVLSRDR
jgi:hypothetical protein